MRQISIVSILWISISAVFSTTALAQEVLPIEAFATRPVVSNVALSPDGRYLAYRVAQTRDGEYYIEVRNTEDLSDDPVRLGSNRMDITGFSWVSDDRMRVSFVQQVRDRIEGQNSGVFQSKQAIVRADGRGRFQELYDDLRVIDPLWDRPDEILVYTAELNYEDSNRDAIRASGRSVSGINADFQILNVNTMNSRTELRGNQRLGGYMSDYQGNIRISRAFDPATREVIYYHRSADGAGEWDEFFRSRSENTEEQFSIVGFDPLNPNMLFVSANRGHDTASIYELSLLDGSFGERVFGYDMIAGTPPQDISGAWSSTDPDHNRRITGFVYFDADGHRQIAFIDGEAQALQAQLEATFPGKSVTISSRSRGSQHMIIYTESSRDPGTYYLLSHGQLQMVGQRRPLLDEDDLAEVQYIEYEARDGRTIPAYVTVPQGEGPFPLIVMPHGGPWVPYRTTGFDEWGQFLASQGYMVMEPLFRGTTGLGVDHWTSSFGEWGMAMSDDMDDGALHLAETGLVDPERIAMFGWSFGGYSAFAASLRDPQVYQCSIAGAGVGDPVEFRAFFTRNRFQRAVLEEGYAGLNTIARASDVNIPILVIHGDLDQRVRLYHSEQFVAELEQNNKPHRFVVLEGADHFDNTLTFDHRVTLYSEMLSFLQNDCGPGGL